MPSNYEMSSRSNSRCKSGPISVNPNRMFMKKGESMNKVGGNNVLLDDQQQLFNEEDVQRNI